MKYYKLITGFNAEDFIQIDETELEKAYACFLQKKDGIFSGGAVRGSRIDSIKPDFHRIMGWNRGHKLETLDFEELNDKGIDRGCQMQLGAAKDKVVYLMETNQMHLIGKSVPELDKKSDEKPPELPDTSALVKKMRV